jgi:hypothetical protein
MDGCERLLHKTRNESFFNGDNKPMKSPIKSLALIGIAAMFLIIAPALPVTRGDSTKAQRNSSEISPIAMHNRPEVNHEMDKHKRSACTCRRWIEPLRREFGRDKEAVSCKEMGRPKVKGRTGDGLEARATMVPDRRSTMIYLFMEIGCELQ